MDDFPKKYLVEGDINFFAELKKTIGHAATDTTTTDIVTSPYNVCLITNNALTEHHVTLPCNHTFNYIPLYNEVNIQKCVKNTAETSKLLINELKCPYCRKIHKTVLPYYEELCDKCPPLYGVNTTDLKYKINNCCNYVKYTYIDGAQIHCDLAGDNLHYHEDDKQYYCYNHLYMVCKKKQLLQKNVIKEAKIAAKLALKANPIPLSTTIIDAIDDTNEVVIMTANANSCAQILKTGLFKGDPCNKPIYKKYMCKRHFNLSNAKLLDAVTTLPQDDQI